ncbi:neurogenic locus notch homolog protein 1, partial [Elysia marginata]
YDPRYPCRLARVETDLLRRDPASPFSPTERVTFRTLLRAQQGTNIIPNPFEVQFEEWKGPVRMSVFVTCCGASSIHEGQCNEVMTASISTWPVMANTGPQNLRFRLTGRASMTVMANAVCDENYYSHSCNVFCSVDNPATEHAFCNATTGSRQCLAGYEGPDCQVDVDECLTQEGKVCRNGGVCRNSPGSFSCACPFSTTGRICEQRYPVCHLRPCQHQGTCVETTSGSLCLCMPGFEGQWCHMLEGQEDERSESSQSRNEISNVVTTPKTLIFTTTKAVAAGPSRTKKSQKEVRRKRYQVNSDSAALTNMTSTASIALTEQVLPIPQAPRATKTRSFNNAVYDDEERVGGTSSTASSFQLFYNNSNGSLHSSHDTYGNTNSITLSNNNILSARALMQQDSTGKVNFKDKTLVKPKSMGGGGDGNSTGKSKGKYYEDRGYPSTSKASGPLNTQSVKNDKSNSKSARKDGTLNHHGGYVNQGKPLDVDVSSPKSTNNKSRSIYNGHSEAKTSGVYQPKPKQGTVQREMRYPLREAQHEDPAVETRATKPDERSERQRRSQVSNKRQSEHFYEDIDSAYTLSPHAPKPKPRSIHNVRSDTLRRKEYTWNASDDIDNDSIADEVELPLAPPPPPLLSATAVAAVAFSSRIQGQPRVNDTQPALERPVSIRYEQPRNSDGSLDYSPSDFTHRGWPTAQEAENSTHGGSQKWYSDQYVKSSPHVLTPKPNQDNSFFSDTGSVYCLQQSQRRSTPKSTDIDPRQSSREQWEDKWRNQPVLPPPSRGRNQPSASAYSSKKVWPHSYSHHGGTPSQVNTNARGGPSYITPGNKSHHASERRPDSGYVSNQDLSLKSMPRERRGSADALLGYQSGSEPQGCKGDGLHESKRSRSGEALHSYGEPFAPPAGHSQPRRRSEPFVGVNYPRSSIARENRDGRSWSGGEHRGSEDRRRSSHHGSNHGGSSLSVAPNVSSSFV